MAGFRFNLEPSSAGSQLPSQQVTVPSSGIGAQVQAKVHQTTTTIGVPTGPITIVEKQQHHHQQQQQHPHHPNPNRQQIHQQQPQHQQHKEIKFRSAPIKTVSNGSTMYSVLYAGNGNKITIKRKMDPPHIQRKATIHTLDKEGQIKLAKTLADNSAAMSGFKMPQTTGLATSGGGGAMGGQGNVTVVNATNAGAMSKQTAKQLLKRRGCRCGNATATPGKLTCCGQRCPCYVDSKSCVDCKCRGCRNPHRADGMKVRPHIPELQNLEINLHNPNEEEVLTTATTTVLAPQQTVSSISTNSGTHINVLGQTSLASTSVGQQPNAGLTAVSTGAKGLTQISHLPGGSTLKITPTSIANVLNSTNHQLIGGPDGMEMVPSGGLLDSNGFSYITQASLDTGTGVGVAPTGPTTTQYNVSNGGTIHVHRSVFSKMARNGGGDLAVAAVPGRSHNPLSLPSIQLLQGRNNWSTWRFAVQTFLELEDLWETVKPAENPDGTFVQVDASKDRRARGKIILLLDPVNYIHVKDVTTARETWSRLEAAFENSGLTRKVGLLRKLITTSLGNCESMEAFVNSIIETAHQLRGID
ncbi:AAEL017254-PA [Aedes aegypti]|uniref:AAEL017254-PA n=1 Tax=Aedes aegypti TaxID=7159 RepID=J9HZT2_AEDAE|nr:AAEL017254-PA [Aedes aegypti]